MPKSRRPRRKAPTELAPISGPDSFGDLSDPHHVHSQAATLLLIGSSLRGDLVAMRPAFAALGPTPRPGVKLVPEEDLQSLGFPAVRVSGERFRPAELRQLSGSRPIPKAVRAAPARVTDVAEAFYKAPDPTTAAALLAACLRHPHALARAAAAASYFEIAVNPTPALRTLESALGSRNLLVRDVAAYALARADPKNPRLAKVLAPEDEDLSPPPVAHQPRSSTARGRVARVGGSLRTETSGNICRETSTRASTEHKTGSLGAAATATRRARSRAPSCMTGCGGRISGGWISTLIVTAAACAMLANQAGTDVGRMALLSCPVHWPKYTPDFSHTQKVVSIRVHLDLVILADGGGQRFEDPNIAENVLPIWFDHFATHDPANWQKYDIPAKL